jgi:two-component system NtrC family sensor kinase
MPPHPADPAGQSVPTLEATRRIAPETASAFPPDSSGNSEAALRRENERLRAENEQLRRHNQQLRKDDWQRRFFHISAELMCVADPSGRFLVVNDAFEKVLGYRKGELLSRPFTEFVHPDDLEATLREAALAFAGSGSALFRNRYRTKTGEYRWLSWLSDTDPESGNVYAVARDVTEAHTTAARLKVISESIPGAVYQFALGPDEAIGYFPYLSPGILELYGLKPEDIATSQQAMFDAVHEEDMAILQASTERSRVDLSEWRCHYRIVTPAGETKWVQGRARPERLEDGTVVWEGILLDVTDLRRAETQLHERERRLSWLFEQSPMAAVEWDLDLRVKTWNAAAVKTFGFSASEAIGRHATELMWPTDSEGVAVLTDLGQATLGMLLERRVTGENRTRAGRRIQCSWFHRTLVDDEGQPVSILSKAWDVTEQKAAEEELRRYRHAVESSSHAIGMTDGQGRHCYQNEAFTKLYGYETAEEFNAAGGIPAIFEDSAIARDVLDTLARGETWMGEVRQCDRDGKALEILLRADPIFDDEDQVIGYMGLNADITNLKETQRQLQTAKAKAEKSLRQLQRTQAQLIQNEKMSSLGQLVAGIAHEINNPASFIGGNLSHAQSYIHDLLEVVETYMAHCPQPTGAIAEIHEEIDVDFIRKDVPELLGSMRTGVKRIQTIVDSLKTFARLDEAQVKEVDLHESIESTLTVLSSRWQPLNGGATIAIERSYGFEGDVECFAGDLNQVFAHLITNAIDAIEERLAQVGGPPGCIEISTAPAINGGVQIAIADNGAGIPEEAREALYDPFFTTKAIGRGTGLGLSMAYQTVVDKHGGRLHHEDRPGGGTIAIIEIPLRLGDRVPLVIAS